MGGRFPVHIWPRPLSWGFEWHDVTKPLVLVTLLDALSEALARRAGR